MRCALPLVVVLACRTPAPGKPTAIECTGQALQQQGPQVLPAVLQCLSAIESSAVTPCLLGLIVPAAGVTEAVIACLVRSAAEPVGAAGRTPLVQEHARAFLRERGYVFLSPRP